MATSQLLNESLITQLAKYASDIGSSYFEDIVSPRQLSMITTNNIHGLDDELLKNLGITRFSRDKSEISHARVCPLCIEENKAHYQEFQSKEVIVCPIHQCLLVDLCPHCSESLDFDTNLFRGICTNYRCHEKLEACYPVASFYELTQQQTIDCLYAGLFEKHFQSGQVSFKKANVKGVSQLALRGYELLVLEADTNQLIHSVNEHFEIAAVLPGFIPYILKTMLGGLSTEWPWSKWADTTSLVKPALKEAGKLVSVPSSFFCNALNISPDTLYLLSEASLIKVNNGTRLTNKSIIDITKFVETLTSMPMLQDGVSFSAFKQSNQGYSITLDELFVAWLKEEIQIGFLSNLTFENSIFVNPTELRKWMLKNASNITKQKLTSHEALDILKMSKRKFNSLINDGKLKAVKTESGLMHRFEDVAALKHELTSTPQLSFFI